MDNTTSRSIHRFKKSVVIFFLLGLFVFLISLAFYSPSGDSFTRSSLFSLSVMGGVLGGFVFLIGTITSAFIFLPHELSSSADHSFRDDFDDFRFARENINNISHHDSDRWYLDTTNPASPSYIRQPSSLD